MTMMEMVLDLENRGFKTTKAYLPGMQKYKFTLTKDGVTRDYWFEYPKENEWTRHKIQLNWLRDVVGDFKRWADMAKLQTSITALKGNMDTGYYYDTDSMNYINNDLEETKKMANYNTYYGWVNGKRHRTYTQYGLPAIEKVIFNAPATIVLWKDGTKTVVKAENEWFDPEKGLAMAIAKKAMGNKGNYFNEIKKWVKPYEEAAEKEAEEILNSAKAWDGEIELADVNNCLEEEV